MCGFLSHILFEQLFSPDFINVDIVTPVNSSSSDNGPLSLRLVEEAFNKCLEKYFNLQCVISAVSSNLNVMDKCHAVLYR
jgi:hypothetical protein